LRDLCGDVVESGADGAYERARIVIGDGRLRRTSLEETTAVAERTSTATLAMCFGRSLRRTPTFA
jgi:hypothetical protein